MKTSYMTNEQRSLCLKCNLTCEYREWDLVKNDANQISTAKQIKAFSRQNPKCPKMKGKYDELMAKCKERDAYNENLQVCTICKNRSRLITMKDLKGVPAKCPMLDAFKEIMPQLSEILVPITLSFEQSMTDMAKITSNIENSLLDASKRIMDSIGFMAETSFKDFEHGIGFIPSFLSLSKVKVLYDLWRTEKKDEIGNFFVNLFNQKESIDFLISEICSHQSFKPRANVIRDALYAHLEGKYSLSIPVLWSQIDGIFIKNFSGLIVIVEKCNACGRSSSPNLKSITRKLKESEDRFFWSAFLDFVESIYGKERNKILHGLDVTYPDVKRSTTLILSLYELFTFIQSFEKGKWN